MAGAIAAEASYLATYDRQHLLHFAERIYGIFGIMVATPADIVQLAE